MVFKASCSTFYLPNSHLEKRIRLPGASFQQPSCHSLSATKDTDTDASTHVLSGPIIYPLLVPDTTTLCCHFDSQQSGEKDGQWNWMRKRATWAAPEKLLNKEWWPSNCMQEMQNAGNWRQLWGWKIDCIPLPYVYLPAPTNLRGGNGSNYNLPVRLPSSRNY